MEPHAHFTLCYVTDEPIGGKKQCRDPGSNRGPLDLQSNALPTELSRHMTSTVTWKRPAKGGYRLGLKTCARLKIWQQEQRKDCQVPPRFELGSLDSESKVLTITPWDQALHFANFLRMRLLGGQLGQEEESKEHYSSCPKHIRLTKTSVGSSGI